MVKNFKNIFLWNQEADDFETWYTASVTRVLTIFHMMTLGWPWLFVWQGQICFRMLLHGWKLIQLWVLMYFQVCSNSTYAQHSGERYRTNGPLVFLFQRKFSSSTLGSTTLENTLCQSVCVCVCTISVSFCKILFSCKPLSILKTLALTLFH